MKINFLIALLFTSASLMNVYGQKYDTSQFSFTNFYFNGTVGVPSKEFQEAVQNDFGNLGYGFSGGFLVSPLLENKPSPVLLGLDLGYFLYGVDKQPAAASTPAYKTTFQVFTLNAIGRLRPRLIRGGVTPFIDGMIGIKTYNATTKIDKNLLNIIFNDDQPEIINDENDTGLNYGLGAGFYTNGKNSQSPGFTLRFLYLFGDEVEYVVRNSLKVTSGGLVTFDTARTNTNMFVIQLGISGASLKTLLTSE